MARAAGPWIVAFELSDGIVAMALSYELRHDELEQWVSALEQVDEAAWRAAGGGDAPADAAP